MAFKYGLKRWFYVSYTHICLDLTQFWLFSITVMFQLNVRGVVIATWDESLVMSFVCKINTTQQWRTSRQRCTCCQTDGSSAL